MSARRAVSLALVAALLSIAFVLAPSQPAPAAASEGPGIIAYVRRSTHDIHVISPDGTGDRVLWTAPRPLSVNPHFSKDDIVHPEVAGIYLNSVGDPSGGTQHRSWAMTVPLERRRSIELLS